MKARHLRRHSDPSASNSGELARTSRESGVRERAGYRRNTRPSPLSSCPSLRRWWRRPAHDGRVAVPQRLGFGRISSTAAGQPACQHDWMAHRVSASSGVSRRGTASTRPRWLVAALVVGSVAACGTGPSTTQSEPPGGSGSSPTQRLVSRPSAGSLSTAGTGTVMSVGRSPRQTSPGPDGIIDLRRVVVKTGTRTLVATVSTYTPTRGLTSHSCGAVGVYFVSQHLVLLSSDRIHGEAEKMVPQSKVTFRLLSAHTARLSVPIAALGSRFTPTEAWRGFSQGPYCPPLGVAGDRTGLVTPHR